MLNYRRGSETDPAIVVNMKENMAESNKKKGDPDSLEDYFEEILKLLREQNTLLRQMSRQKQPYANKTGMKRG